MKTRASSRVLSAMLAVLMLAVGFPFAVNATEPPAPVISLDTAKGDAGDTVSLTLSVDCASENYAGFANLLVKVAYDEDSLELTGAEPLLNEGNFIDSENYITPYVLSWTNATDNYKKADAGYTGALATLTFKIKDTAEAGEYPVTVASQLISGAEDGLDCNYFYAVDGNGEIILDTDKNSTELPLGNTYTNGKITVNDTTAPVISNITKSTADATDETVTVNFTVSDDYSGVSTVTVKRDDGTVITNTGSSFEASINADYTITATDAADNKASETVTVNNINEYTITLKPNSGFIDNDTAVKYGSMAMEIIAEPSRPGYSFLGWALTADAVEALYQKRFVYEENKDITLFAVWETAVETPKPVISIGGAEAHPGDTVDVAIVLDCDADSYVGFANLVFEVGYATDALELIGTVSNVTGGEFYESPTLTTEPYRLLWSDGFENIKSGVGDNDGTLATLTFRVRNTAAAGDYTVTAKSISDNRYVEGLDFNYYYFEDDNGVVKTGDITSEIPLEPTYTNGKITVTRIAPAVSVSETSGDAGDTVALTVSVDCDDPHYIGFSNYFLNIGYNADAFELIEAESVIGGSFTGSEALDVNPYVLIWLNHVENYKVGVGDNDGTLATLTFKIKDAAAAGEYPITVTSGSIAGQTEGDDFNYYYRENEQGEVIRINNDTVYLPLANTYTNGKITVNDTTAPVVSGVVKSTETATVENVTVSFTVTDDFSGVASVKVTRGTSEYTVNGSYGFIADRNGDYTVTVKDNAGNEKNETITISNIIEFVVTYNMNGGIDAIEPSVKRPGASVTIAAAVRSGYTFMGWGAAADSTTAIYQSGDTYSADADITLFAMWKLAKIEPPVNSELIRIEPDPYKPEEKPLIKGFTTGTTLEQLEKKLPEGAEYKALDKDGNEVTDITKVMGTGSKIQMLDERGTVVDEVVVIVKGDANGDGKSTASDASHILRLLANWNIMRYDAALDFNGDGKVNAADAAHMLRWIAKWPVEIH